METSLTFTDPSGHRVSAVLTTPPAGARAVVVLLHGFLSNKQSTTNKTLTRLLTDKGLATFRFDFFGQGDSEGPFERITVSLAEGQARAALALMRDKGFSRIGLIGSSFGGLVALRAASSCPTLACLGLKCPVPDFEEMLRLEFGENGLAEWHRTGTIPDVTGKTDRVPLHFDFFEDCRRQKGYDAARVLRVPTLIVQGDQDEYVPLHQAQRLHEALPGPKRLDVLPGADHGFTNAEDFRAMIAALEGWMTAHLLA